MNNEQHDTLIDMVEEARVRLSGALNFAAKIDAPDGIRYRLRMALEVLERAQDIVNGGEDDE